MRLYLGLLLTTAIEALLALIGLSILIAATVYAIAQGVMIEAVVIVGFSALVAGAWVLYGPLKFERFLLGILRHFAGEPQTDLLLFKAKNRAFFLAVSVAVGAGVLIFLPLAILLSGWIQRDIFESFKFVFYLELFIGAPTLLFFGTRAYSRAKDHFFQGDDGPPKSPDLDDRIRTSLDNDLNSPS